MNDFLERMALVCFNTVAAIPRRMDIIEPGARTGHFRIGGDQLLTDDKGESRISVDDYAVAFVDEIERGAHARQRMTVAY